MCLATIHTKAKQNLQNPGILEILFCFRFRDGKANQFPPDCLSHLFSYWSCWPRTSHNNRPHLRIKIKSQRFSFAFVIQQRENPKSREFYLFFACNIGGHFGPEKKYLGPPPLPAHPPTARYPPPPSLFPKKSKPPFASDSSSLSTCQNRKKNKKYPKRPPSYCFCDDGTLSAHTPKFRGCQFHPLNLGGG